MQIADMICASISNAVHKAELDSLVRHMQGVMNKLMDYTATRPLKTYRVRASRAVGNRIVRNYLGDEFRLDDYQLNQMGTNEVREYLGDDFRFLGNGHFGLVFLHKPTNLAVKITGFHLGGLDSYPLFAKFIQDNTNLKHLPEILHFQEYTNRNGGAYFVIMPKYSDGYFEQETRREMEHIIRNGTTSEPKDIDVDYRESMIETCKALSVLAGFAKVDLHGGNIMFDWQNFPVITDPFSFTRSDY